jgi:hypothetical protein
MINPMVGSFARAIGRRFDLDQLERGMGEEEAKALTRALMASNPTASKAFGAPFFGEG